LEWTSKDIYELVQESSRLAIQEDYQLLYKKSFSSQSKAIRRYQGLHFSKIIAVNRIRSSE